MIKLIWTIIFAKRCASANLRRHVDDPVEQRRLGLRGQQHRVWLRVAANRVDERVGRVQIGDDLADGRDGRHAAQGRAVAYVKGMTRSRAFCTKGLRLCELPRTH